MSEQLTDYLSWLDSQAEHYRLNPQVHSTFKECASRLRKVLEPTPEHAHDFEGSDGGLMPGDQWRDAIERALGVEPDPVEHTPAWAHERVLTIREIGNGVRDESGPIN